MLHLPTSDGGTICMAQVNTKAIQIRAKEYFKANWGSPFIVGFIVLLLSAATLLSLGSSYWAEQIAVYAYIALVIGVVLQLVCYLKYKKSSEEAP
jgi:heme/copper-type cytochrome/quinol oxidase subunit 4